MKNKGFALLLCMVLMSSGCTTSREGGEREPIAANSPAAASRATASPTATPPAESAEAAVDQTIDSLAEAAKEAAGGALAAVSSARDGAQTALDSLSGLPVAINGEPAESTSWSFDLGTKRIPLAHTTEKIRISNRNGRVAFKQGDVSEVEVSVTVVVDHKSREEAKTIADRAELRVTSGSVLEIATFGDGEGTAALHPPRFLLTVTLPRQMTALLQAEQVNGDLSVDGYTGGRVDLSTENGRIQAKHLEGDAVLRLVNGTIEVSDAKQGVQATAVNGEIVAKRIDGPLNVELTTGRLSASEAFSSVKASVTTGTVRVESSKVHGDWDVESSAGSVTLAWPEGQDVKVEGEAGVGKARTDWPLSAKRQHVTGTLGKGTYRVRASALAGLSLLKQD